MLVCGVLCTCCVLGPHYIVYVHFPATAIWVFDCLLAVTYAIVKGAVCEVVLCSCISFSDWKEIIQYPFTPFSCHLGCRALQNLCIMVSGTPAKQTGQL